MPAPQIPNGSLVADIVIGTPYRHLRSRLYYVSDTAPETESNLVVIADAIKSHLTPTLPALLPDTNAFNRVEVKYYGAGDTLIFAQSSAAAGFGLIDAPDAQDEDGGSESEDIMPTETALIIQRKTGFRGRSNQGRIFIGGIAETVQMRGLIANDFIAPVKTFAAKLNVDINVAGSGFTSVLHARHWNRKTNVLRPVTKIYVVAGTGTRRDRRIKAFRERLT